MGTINIHPVPFLIIILFFSFMGCFIGYMKNEVNHRQMEVIKITELDYNTTISLCNFLKNAGIQ